LAFSLSTIINFVILIIVLWNQFGNVDISRISSSVLKISAASAACGLSIQVTEKILEAIGLKSLDSFLDVILQSGIAGIAGISVFAVFCYVLKCEEGFDFWRSIKKRIPIKKVEIGDHGEARGI
jgi:hypothetical protein